jgi:hypothetical protein
MIVLLHFLCSRPSSTPTSTSCFNAIKSNKIIFLAHQVGLQTAIQCCQSKEILLPTSHLLFPFQQHEYLHNNTCSSEIIETWVKSEMFSTPHGPHSCHKNLSTQSHSVELFFCQIRVFTSLWHQYPSMLRQMPSTPKIYSAANLFWISVTNIALKHNQQSTISWTSWHARVNESSKGICTSTGW